METIDIRNSYIYITLVRWLDGRIKILGALVQVQHVMKVGIKPYHLNYFKGKKMPILNYTTKVPVSKSLEHINKKLALAGAKAILINYKDGKASDITFSIETPHGLVYFKLPANIQGVSKALSDDNCYRDEAHARRVAWRILKDWIESQLAIIDAGMAELSQVFLPYAQTASGETVYELANKTGMKLLK